MTWNSQHSCSTDSPVPRLSLKWLRQECLETFIQMLLKGLAFRQPFNLATGVLFVDLWSRELFLSAPAFLHRNKLFRIFRLLKMAPLTSWMLSNRSLIVLRWSFRKVLTKSQNCGETKIYGNTLVDPQMFQKSILKATHT